MRCAAVIRVVEPGEATGPARDGALLPAGPGGHVPPPQLLSSSCERQGRLAGGCAGASPWRTGGTRLQLRRRRCSRPVRAPLPGARAPCTAPHRAAALPALRPLTLCSATSLPRHTRHLLCPCCSPSVPCGILAGLSPSLGAFGFPPLLRHLVVPLFPPSASTP